jgi:hypothetical protein
MKDLEKMLADFAAKGGKVTKVEEGRSVLAEQKAERRQEAKWADAELRWENKMLGEE